VAGEKDEEKRRKKSLEAPTVNCRVGGEKRGKEEKNVTSLSKGEREGGPRKVKGVPEDLGLLKRISLVVFCFFCFFFLFVLFFCFCVFLFLVFFFFFFLCFFFRRAPLRAFTPRAERVKRVSTTLHIFSGGCYANK